MKYEAFKTSLEEALKARAIQFEHVVKIPDSIEISLNGDSSLKILNDDYETHDKNIKQLRLNKELDLFEFWNPCGMRFVYSIEAINGICVDYETSDININKKGIKYDPYASFFETYRLCEIPEK